MQLVVRNVAVGELPPLVVAKPPSTEDKRSFKLLPRHMRLVLLHLLFVLDEASAERGITIHVIEIKIAEVCEERQIVQKSLLVCLPLHRDLMRSCRHHRLDLVKLELVMCSRLWLE